MSDRFALGAPAGELGFAVLRAPESRTGWWRFARPQRVLQTGRAEEVGGLLSEVEWAVEGGRWAVGFVAYEAAPGFDRQLTVRRGAGPLALFGLGDPPVEIELQGAPLARSELPELEPALSRQGHATAVATIRAAIARGDTYQVNFTFPLTGRLPVSPERLFLALAPAARTPYAAFLDLGETALLSLSPELFFERDGARLTMRP